MLFELSARLKKWGARQAQKARVSRFITRSGHTASERAKDAEKYRGWAKDKHKVPRTRREGSTDEKFQLSISRLVLPVYALRYNLFKSNLSVLFRFTFHLKNYSKSNIDRQKFISFFFQMTLGGDEPRLCWHWHLLIPAL